MNIFRLIHQYAALSALCILSLNAVAASSDFYPNCNMRSLALNNEQQNQLRQIRKEHKKNIERVRRKSQTNSPARKQELIRVLSDSRFNPTEARRYLQSRYESDMEIAMEELSVQHKIFQALNPYQRELWILNCTR